MSIRLETSKRTGIKNHQDSEVGTMFLNWSVTLPGKHPYAHQRTDLSPIYNCHGLTFACRRTRIEDGRELARILSDDHWEEIDVTDVLPGDVVIYFSEEGEADHSGIVVDSGGALHVPLICSKWGSAGEWLHRLSDHPPLYGSTTKFYRCRL